MSAAIVKKLQRRKEEINSIVQLVEDQVSSYSNVPNEEEALTLELYIEEVTSAMREIVTIKNELLDEDVDITSEVLSVKNKCITVLEKAKAKVRNAAPSNNNTLIPITKAPQVKLPVVEIPTFSGAYDKWTAFRDSFKSLIHNNVTLSKIQKFHYLQSALKGEAASLLQCISLSNDGYDIAWDRLNKRYHNERFLVKKHVKTLLNLPEMKKGDHISLRQLIDTVSMTLSSLKSLKRPADTWDDMIVEIVAEKLDIQLNKEWEGETCDQVPSYEKMETFLIAKCKQLEAVKNNTFSVKDRESSTNHKLKVLHTNITERKCLYCQENHTLYKCEKFINMNVQQRIGIAKQNHLCFNCLGKNHSVNNCTSNTCRKCNKRHHTMLHFTEKRPETTKSSNVSSTSVTTTTGVNIGYTPSQVLLSTCKVLIKDKRGREQSVRALLDTGSQANLITESCAKRLGLSHINTNVPIVGIGGKTNSLDRAVILKIASRVSNFRLSCSALVIEKITDIIPSRVLEFNSIHIPTGIELADPVFYEPHEIDILIGNAHYNDILSDGQLNVNKLSLFNTHFGWVIYGQLPYKNVTRRQDNTIVSHVNLNDQLSKFWELESYKNETLTPADKRCEEHFKGHVKRDETGRFIVALPFKENPSRLGNSSETAKHRFLALERRLLKTPDTYSQYRAFMSEYENLGHMRKTIGDEKDGYYLPHHCVKKLDSLTTKLRVVFNASAPTSNGISLNDILMIGPPVQNDLFSIMTRMRCWKYVMTADVAKMYRQVKIRTDDVKYQRIWWRKCPEDTLTSYELTTVTYGTASAAYLAIRALRELAQQMSNEYPIGSQRCLSDFYVDDLITGANSSYELKQVRDQINNLLISGGFELKQWASNNRDIFVDFKTDCADNVTVLTRDSDNITNFITTLGTMWNINNDTLSYKCNMLPSRATTKRSVLSEISRVYDPLGLIGPVIIIGKVFIQELWKLQSGWDEPLPNSYIQRWQDYIEDLKNVSLISIPRMVILHNNCNLELHGFSDASGKAFGACVYFVEIKEDRRVHSRLLCAKSRVTPVKSTSIPRLELCAAVLLAELCNRIQKALNHLQFKCFYYSDSTITLSWIKSESRRFKTFVANRIGEIHKLSDPQDWTHVMTNENPADLISRGASAKNLKDESPPELRCNLVSILPKDVLLPECSTFEKTIRVMAYVIRFISKCKKQNVLCRGPFTVHELKHATNVLIKNLQRLTFHREFELLSKGLSVHKTSKLYKLNPFLSSEGLILVGGRLANSDLPTGRRFPIVLPANQQITKLIVTSVHQTNLHIGCQGTLAAIRLKYWPIAGRKTVREVLRLCVKCIRAKPHSQSPLMGALPSFRIQQTRPFLRSGVDYCGPFIIKEGSRRSKKTTKAYVCIFVCCSIKAVHIEIVSNLTTEAFIAAFNRFISRRGCVKEIISDNATYFIGARNHLKELYVFLRNEENVSYLTSTLAQKHIKWTFIPPRAPHFGGLWEAAVKSVKTHIHRVAGKALLTLEEMTTLLIQIEAVLNSRPLCPLTNDPNDYDALTPAHFLIGDTPTAPINPDIQDIPCNRLKRWELVTKLHQHIWKRWSREYLSELHIRGKWNIKNVLPKEGQLVLIKEDNLPPLQWQLGRIEKIHLGPDNIPRSALIRTSTTRMVRPMVKLCFFLSDEH